MVKGIYGGCATALLLGSLAHPAQAAGATNQFHITEIAARESGFEITTTDTISNPSGCSLPHQLRVNKTEQNYETIVSTLTTAFVTGKKVYVWTSGCHTDNRVAFIAAYVVY